MAMNANRNLGINNNAQQSSMEKLSSGMRINRAGDDAAGLAISEKMRTQINGLAQASRNAQDGISLIQTAEGALGESQEMLQRCRELAIQALNDTYTDSDREKLDLEVQELLSEIDGIAEKTEFNGLNLLGGAEPDTDSMKTAAASLSAALAEALLANDAETTPNLEIDKTSTDGLDVTLLQAAVDDYISGASSVDYSSVKSIEDIVYAYITDENSTVDDEAFTATGGVGGDVAGAYSGSTISDTADRVDVSKTDVDALVANALSAATIALENNLDTTLTLASTEFSTSVSAFTSASSGSQVYDFHVGANENQKISVTIDCMDAAALGVDAINILDKENASAALAAIDNAIEMISAQRATLGAVQNRLEHTVKNVDNTAENLQAAESQIRDTDMASEMVTLTKYNILAQASQSMLAQANQSPQQVLQLLG